MKPAKAIRKKLQDNTPILGAIATFHLWIGIVEISKAAGLDYLIVDLEHQRFEEALVSDICAVGRQVDLAIFIRPPSCHPTEIRLAMDKGPCGLLVPMIETLADLESIQEGAFMPPCGRRRPGGPGNRWVPDYHYSTWKREVEDDLIILPQIESPTGLENVEAIAAHPVTTAIAIGPYDLSANLGVCWQPDNPVLQHAIDRIHNAARHANKSMWMIGDGPTLRKRGFSFICLTEPMMLLENTLKNLIEQTRTHNSTHAAQNDRPLP